MQTVITTRYDLGLVEYQLQIKIPFVVALNCAVVAYIFIHTQFANRRHLHRKTWNRTVISDVKTSLNSWQTSLPVFC